MLNQNEIEKYSRQIILEDLGEEGQLKLKKARVMVVGAGGLGCPVLQYLTAAGAGNIGIIDDDLVDLSNLHRQVLYNEEDIDKPKAEAAAEKLRKQNSDINIVAYNEKLNSQNVNSLLKDYEVIVDCTDNFESRYVIDIYCDKTATPMVYGSVHRFQGQVCVFNYGRGQIIDPTIYESLSDDKYFESPTYRCLYPKPPEAGSGLDCSEGGVIGVLPGIIGSMQAAEVIKIITGIGEVLSGKLLCFDMKTMESTIIGIKRNIKDSGFSSSGDKELWKLIMEDPDDSRFSSEYYGEEIYAEILMNWMREKKDIQIIDVRENKKSWFKSDEHYGLDGIKIPLSELVKNPKSVSREKDVVLFCDSGNISHEALIILKEKYEFTNVYNLRGGMKGWIKMKKELHRK